MCFTRSSSSAWLPGPAVASSSRCAGGDIDLDAGKVTIERSYEQTNQGLSIKAPKTKAGRRVVTVPPSITAEQKKHWRQQQEQRLALGLGKTGPEDPVFARPGGVPWPPDALT
jgi:hypothetical protein